MKGDFAAPGARLHLQFWLAATHPTELEYPLCLPFSDLTGRMHVVPVDIEGSFAIPVHVGHNHVGVGLSLPLLSSGAWTTQK
jgi:hypothetical protein